MSTGNIASIEQALPGRGAAAAEFTVLHEYGHAADMKKLGLNAAGYTADWWEDPVSNELRATENAGRAAAEVLSIYGQIGIKHYLSINPDQSDTAHGTFATHTQAFETGIRESR
jgi:hypothetical protein